MALYVVLGTLAAFGALCALCAGFGWLLPHSGGVLHYCPETAQDAVTFAGRYLWLKRMGLIRCGLVIMDTELNETEKNWLTQRGILVSAEQGIGAESN